MSRRMDISSLLCDEPDTRPPLAGLDALVHAASQERTRVDHPPIRHHSPPEPSPLSTSPPMQAYHGYHQTVHDEHARISPVLASPTRYAPAPSISPHQHLARDRAPEQDAHEWLLTHYAPSPPRSPPPMQWRTKQTPERIASPRETTRRPHEREYVEDDSRVVQEGSSRRGWEQDALYEGGGEPDESMGADAMDIDVDAELLSLVCDQPPPRHPSLDAPGPSSRHRLPSPRSPDAPSQSQAKPRQGSSSSKGKLVSTPVIAPPHPPPQIVVDTVPPTSPSTSKFIIPSYQDLTPVGPSALATFSNVDKERASMPPPGSVPEGAKGKDSTGADAGKKGAASKKKKEPASKPPPKPKPPPKQRVKSGPSTATTAKSKSKPLTASPAPHTLSRGPHRSRSVSTLRTAGAEGKENAYVDREKENEGQGEEREDDKLYCVCKTRYDEERVMIACDRCDEWYHTQCVNMPDAEVDLVDQFICPPCIEANPTLPLHTTYRKRCHFGLNHPDPSSPQACRKPARGALSKYCSDECGVKHMRMKIERWEKQKEEQERVKGGEGEGRQEGEVDWKERLWESVKGATRTEGVVVRVGEQNQKEGNGEAESRGGQDASAGMEVEVDASTAQVKQESTDPPTISTDLIAPTSTPALNSRKTQYSISLLDTRLTHLVTERDALKRGMELVLWRERLVELSSARAEEVGECGWDQRLCFGEEEWGEFGGEVEESYMRWARGRKVEEGAGEEKELKQEGERNEGGDEVKVDGDTMDIDAKPAATETDANALPAGYGEWWCKGKKKCERHVGWQKLRAADVAFEKELIESSLQKLTTHEREIRKRIEDIMYPSTANSSSSKPFAPTDKVPAPAAATADGVAHAASTSTEKQTHKKKKLKKS